MSETVRLTYGELAKARGITLAAARRMTLRHKWPKQVGNDGMTRVDVPASALTHTGNGTDTAPVTAPAFDEAVIGAIAAATAAAVSDTMADMRVVLPTLQEAITSLRVQLYAAEDRAKQAEKQVQTLQEQLARRWWRRSRL